MRKGPGFTPLRFAKAPILTYVLGGELQPFGLVRERLVSAIRSLREPAGDLMLAVFGLSEETAGVRSLGERRSIYGATIKRSAATVADLEAPALEQLRLQLVTGWYPKSPLTVRVPESHNGVVQESVSIRTVIKDGTWQETRERYRLFAAFDEAEYLTISSSFPGRPVPDGDFTVRTERVNDSYSHQFWHRTPMRRGNFYNLSFRLVPDPEYGDPGLLTEESRAFHEPTRHASFEAVFLGRLPRTLWSYERLTFFERPGLAGTDTRLGLTNRGSCRAKFYDLYGGLFHGIAWKW
ncbi:hypothetical protein SAMN05444157_0716 [Frankineae bacterium MT45]|nr:hypothetical protein SAMN05444157_0716 [Frankineae bacterium MT45]